MTQPNDPNTPPLDYANPGTGYPASYAGPAPDKDSINMAMLCHLLAIFTGFIGPLIIWLIKKDNSPFVDDQGKEALNFQIMMLIATLACLVTLCAAPFLIAAMMIVRLVFTIIATVQANKGIAYRYPVNLRLVK